MMRKLDTEKKTLIRRLGALGAIVVLFVVAMWANDMLGEEEVPVVVPVRTARPVSAAQIGQATEAPAVAQAVQEGDYFEKFVSDRARIREEQIAVLDAVINNKNAKDAVEDAVERKVELTEYMEKEFAVEKILAAKGYDQVAVIVREDQVTVAVGKPTLSQTDVNKIMSAAVQETEEKAGNIKIIPVP